jgi:hypothetical protein
LVVIFIRYENAQMERPVTDFWYAIESCENGVMHLGEAWIEDYYTGNLWLVRGSKRDLLIAVLDSVAPRVPRRPSVLKIKNNLAGSEVME